MMSMLEQRVDVDIRCGRFLKATASLKSDSAEALSLSSLSVPFVSFALLRGYSGKCGQKMLFELTRLFMACDFGCSFSSLLCRLTAIIRLLRTRFVAFTVNKLRLQLSPDCECSKTSVRRRFLEDFWFFLCDSSYSVGVVSS